MRQSHYQFDAGINYKPGALLAPNELLDAKNLYWDGRLRRRKGYDIRSAALDITGVYGSGDVVTLVDQFYYKWGSTEYYYLFLGVDSGGGSTIDKLMVGYYAGIPDSAKTFTILGTAYTVAYTAADHLSIDQLKDKVYYTVGKDDPYVLYIDTTPKVKELPVCATQNDGSTAGASIIANGSSDDWSGTKWLVALSNYLYISDGKTAYFSIADAFGDPAEGIAGSAATVLSNVQANWHSQQYIILDVDLNLYEAVGYNEYVFMYGKKGIQHLYNRDFFANDIDKRVISDIGVRSNLLVTTAGMFWIGEDGGLYGTDGLKVSELNSKWKEHIQDDHSAETDYEDCSLAYHDKHVWVTFPNGTDKEIWWFNPVTIYSQGIEDHAPGYRMQYCQGSGASAIAFTKLHKPQESKKLFGIYNKLLWELDTGYFDYVSGSASKCSISCDFTHFYNDFGAPVNAKQWQGCIIEVDANIDSIVAVKVTMARDRGEATSTTSALDTTASGHQRSCIELDVPYTLDGNSLSVKIAGDATGKTGSGAVAFYGYTVDYEVTPTPKAESTL
jgi:hypothetical protein